MIEKLTAAAAALHEVAREAGVRASVSLSVKGERPAWLEGQGVERAFVSCHGTNGHHACASFQIGKARLMVIRRATDDEARACVRHETSCSLP